MNNQIEGEDIYSQTNQNIGYQNQNVQYSEQTGTNPTLEKKGKSSIIYLIIILVLLALSAFLYFRKTETFAVVFVDGEFVQVELVNKNGLITAKGASGENFIGWYNGNVKYDFNTKVSENLILKSKYEEKVINYKVDFDTDGGSTLDSLTVSAKEKVTTPTIPTKTGYDFVEWQLNGVKYNFDSEVTSDILLKATWVRNNDPITYNVTFDTDGGNEIKVSTVAENAVLTKPTAPTKEGFTFREWQLNGAAYDFKQKVTGNITLKALWIAREKVTVTFNSDGGSAVAVRELYKGDVLGTLPTAPTKANYTFGGWYVGTTAYTAKSTINSSLTLKAKWLTADEAKVVKAIATIKSSYNITAGGQAITVTYSGCTIANTNAADFAKITRGTKDANITLQFSVTCGTATENATSKGIVKASPYKYTAVANESETDYKVEVFNGTTKEVDYKLYNTSSTLIGTYTAGVGAANVLNANIEAFPTIHVQFADENTTFVATKK